MKLFFSRWLAAVMVSALIADSSWSVALGAPELLPSSGSLRALPVIVTVSPAHPSYFTQMAMISRMASARRASPSIALPRLLRQFGLLLKPQSVDVIPLAAMAAFALIAGVFGVQDAGPILWGCGVLGMRFRIPETMRSRRNNPEVIPPLERAIFTAMNFVTVDRGEHESGAFARLPNQAEDRDADVSLRLSGSGGYRWVGAKVVNVKRDSLPRRLDQAVGVSLRRDAKANANVLLEDDVILTGHDRYSTYSDPTDPDEAHPHFGERIRKARVYSNSLVKAVRPVHITIAHNGDFDFFRWWWAESSKTPQAEVKQRLMRILETPIDLELDSVTLALAMSLLRTQGDAFASVRLAFQKSLPWSDQSRLPSRAEYTRWGALLETVFEQMSKELLTSESQTLSQVQNGRQLRFIEALEKEFHAALQTHPDYFGPLPADRVSLFAENAAHVFFENDLFAAAQELSQRAIGSFGVSFASTIDDDIVFYASQQPFYIARHRDHGRLGWNSEGKALAIEVQDEKGEWIWAFQERLQLNQERQEVARVRRDGTTDIYDGLAYRLLSPEEVEKRWVDLRRSPYIRSLRRQDREPKPVRTSIQESSQLLAAAIAEWDNPDSANRQVSRELSKHFVELARLESLGALPRGAHVLLTGYRSDYVFAVQFGKLLKDFMPELRIEWVPANDILLDPDRAARQHALTSETLAIAFCRSGEDFPVLNAVSDLKGRGVTRLIGVTGGVPGDRDTVLSAMLGQLYKEGASPAPVITTGQPWPRRQALVNNHMLTTLAGNRMAMGIVRAIREEFPDGSPLGLEWSLEEAHAAQTMEAGMAQGVASVTGKGETADALRALAAEESPDFRETRSVKWMNRIFFLFPLIYVANEFGWMPHRLIPGLSATLPGLGVMRAGFDLAFIVAVALFLAQIYRLFYARQQGARLFTRVLAITSPEIWYYARDFYRKLLAMSYPEATAFVEGAHPSGDENSDYLQDVAPMLNRGSLVLKTQTDDRMAFRDTLVGTMNMTGTQSRVNRGLNFSRYVLWLNRYLKRYFGVRIPFAHARVITIGRHWASNPNIEDKSIRLPTHYFPIPRPLQAFFEDLKERGVPLSIDQQATFFAARRRFQDTSDLLADRLKIGLELAQDIGLTPDQALVLAARFEAHGLELFNFSEEERARQDRLEEWAVKRLHPIEDYLALAAVFGEALVDPIANPRFLRHQRYPMGRTHDGSLIPTTASPTPGTRVFEILRGRSRSAKSQRLQAGAA